MPFTGSHPAAVLPLTYLGLSTSALVIGSVAPDVPYYVPLMPDSHLTHSPVGIVTVNLAVGLVCLALWHALIAPLALAVAPTSVRRRIPPGPPVRLRRPQPDDARIGLLLLLAIGLGSATHVLWDEFTHIGRFGARHLDWLATEHGPLPGYRWAQYGSGVFGAAVLGLTLWRWWHRADLIPDRGSALPRRAIVAVWTAVLGGTLIGAVTAILHVAVNDLGLRKGFFLTATWGGGAGLLMVGLAAVACAPRLAAARDDQERTSTLP